MKSIRIGLVAGLAAAATIAAPASAQQVPTPDPVKQAIIAGLTAADEAERETIDLACYVVFGADPGDCPS